MARSRSRVDKSERLLVLAVDVDNDLYRKTRISGPLLGRVQNLNGATQLALADPEDTDANTMFQAVKQYDELKEEGYIVNIATITGAESEGYTADREITSQLEQVIAQMKPDVCIFVTDGASDERILPLVESRIKIGSVKSVTVKQSKALESTYVAILEKLKEPHYARIVFGIPAILFLLFAVSYSIGLGWQLPVGIVGLYLLIKGFGLEDTMIESSKGFGFSVERMSFVFYLSTMVFLIASIFIGVSNYLTQFKAGASNTYAIAYGLEGFMLLLPFMSVLYILGRVLDTKAKRYVFKNFKYGVYVGSSIILWVMAFSSLAWLIGQIYFGQFLLLTLAAIIAGIVISTISGFLRMRILRTKRLKNKAVVNELGTLLGKVAGVDVRRGSLVINTNFGNPVRYSVDRIVEISDKIVIK